MPHWYNKALNIAPTYGNLYKEEQIIAKFKQVIQGD